MISLPIDSYLPQIISSWNERSATIINASAGSGKTTRIPWALSLQTPKKIIVLEPRKLAAKMAASRMADENKLKLGEEIGYAYRDDLSFKKDSKVIFFTEGTFLRFIEDPQFFESIDTIIFDEFHERNLDTDLILAIIRQKMVNYPELKIMLMSATIDQSIAEELKAKVIQIEARLFDVKVHYLPNRPSVLNQDLSIKVKKTIESLPTVGDILVFLPGMKEILKSQEMIGNQFGQTFILHSEIEKAEQEKIMLPMKQRKIILATNIAESSLTIPGIKYVIDSGIVRNSEFNPWTGIKYFHDRPITKSSAIQRMFRAGRTQDGECFRLFAEFDYKERADFKTPDILTRDLSDTYLISTYYQHSLQWITPPPSDKWTRAQSLNELLGTTQNSSLTEVGQFAIKNNLGIRIAKILWEARDLTDAQKIKLIQFLSTHILNEDPKYLLKRLSNYLKSSHHAERPFEMARYLLPGLIDQVGRLRSEQHDFIHFSGQTLKSKIDATSLSKGLYLLTQINQKQQVESVLEIEEDWLLELIPFPLKEVTEMSWNHKGIELQSKTVLGSIILDELKSLKRWSELTLDQQNEFIKKNQHQYLTLLENFKSSSQYLRAAFFERFHKRELNFGPSFHRILIESEGEQTTIPFLFAQQLEEQLGVSIDQVTPEQIRINNKNYSINYENEPCIGGHIQDFYGLKETPKILNNTPLTLILLGPHKRPIQYTKDLQGFWDRTYPQFLKEWRREYPRHHWPDDPKSAPPLLLKRHLET